MTVLLLLHSCRSKATRAARGFVQFATDGPGGLFVTGDDQLRNAHAAFNGKGGFAMIDQNDFDFAAVIGIDGTRGVEDGDAVFGG